MPRHEDKCPGFLDVLGALVIDTPYPDEAAIRPYAITDGKTYAMINYCPFCGWNLMRAASRSVMGYEEVHP